MSSSSNQYLIQREEVFWYKRRYPADMVDRIGREYHRVSLKTKDRATARRRRDEEHANYYRVIDQAGDSQLMQMARRFLEVKDEPRDHADDCAEEDVLIEAIEAFVKKHDPSEQKDDTKAALKLLGGKRGDPLLNDLIRDYEKALSKELTNQTVYERIRYIDRWRGAVGGTSPITVLLDPDEAFRWAQGAILDTDLSDTTKRKRLNSLVLFFDWLQSRRIVHTNPFAGIKIVSIKGRKGRNAKEKRRAWTDAELKVLLGKLRDDIENAKTKPAKKNAQRMVPLVIIGMYTGMRIEEICALRIEDIQEDRFSITDGKTGAAVRVVPIHDELRPVLEKLIGERASGWLFEGLSEGGPNKNRSWNIQKAFGRRKKAFGFPPELVFHSLRRCFITKLEEAGTPLMFAKKIAGHKINDLTFGHYSNAELFEERRKAVNSIRYDV